MTKRSANETAPGGSPSKRPRVGASHSSYVADGDGSDASSAASPASTADAETPATAATTPRVKFPSDLKTLACTWPGCAKSFNRPARLRDHLNSHSNLRRFKCPYDGCDKDYVEEKHLKQHVKAAHTHERKYTCPRPGCGKSFVTGTRLRRHQAVHEGADRFRCADCGQRFRKKETLHKHVRKEHLRVPEHECPDADCGEAFDSKARMRRHFVRAHGELRFWCGECGAATADDGSPRRVGFTTEALLQAHLKREHQNCIFCDFKSSARWELERHVETHHSGKSVEDRRVHACTLDGCQKRFTNKTNLYVHARSAHLGVRFVCGDVALSGPGLEAWSGARGCGDGFSTKARLEDHVRYLHLGHARPRLSRPRPREPDAVDELCGAADEARRAVACPRCDARFVRYHDLGLHLERHHPGDAGAADPAALPPRADPGARVPDDAPAARADPDDDDDDDDGCGPCTWDDDFAPGDLFAADEPARDWAGDEADLLLLLRDEPGLGVDAALGDGGLSWEAG